MLIDYLIGVASSSLLLGPMVYMVVWGLHNFDLTVDTIMVWADKQESFLQKMISCSTCLTVQVTLVLTSLHCLAFGLGLWRWVGICLLTSLLALWLLRTITPLDTDTSNK